MSSSVCVVKQAPIVVGSFGTNGDRRTTTAPRDQFKDNVVKNVSRRAEQNRRRRRHPEEENAIFVVVHCRVNKSSSGDGGALVSSSSKRRGFIVSTRKAPEHFKNKNGRCFAALGDRR